mmetsp:Transcript_23296/g.54922  ORF Transcript_23296/g.54922 Transcript_23296/m.54922 type:complete len:124 (+) Transcript_23296:206-577(+)
MSENAEENDANQSKFYRVVSTEPVTDASELFDALSKFLMKDKKRQLSTEYLDEKDQIASRLTWVSTSIRVRIRVCVRVRIRFRVRVRAGGLFFFAGVDCPRYLRFVSFRSLFFRSVFMRCGCF